jgi:cytochrome P450
VVTTMALIQLQSIARAAAAAAILYGVYWIYWELTTGARRRSMIKRHGCLPPKLLPDADPTGFGYFRLKETLRWLKERKLLQGNTSRFAQMGNTFAINVSMIRVVATIEPENLKHMQALDFKNWSIGSMRKKLFTPFLGTGIFTTDGQKWQHSREMLRPSFVRSQIGDPATFEPHVKDLIDAIPRDGSTVDLQELFFRLTIDSATDFLFGESTNCLKPGLSTVSATKFAAAFNGCQESIASTTRMGLLNLFLPMTQFKADCKFVHDFVDEFVQKGLARRESLKHNPHPEGRYIFLNELVTQTSDPYTIRSELLNILLAGRDTTASLLSNVWFVLSKRPDIYAKLRDEVDELDGETLGFERIKEMKYLKAIMNESLRVHPVVPGNSREATCDTVLPLGGGEDGKAPLFCAKGQLVSWNTYVMHRRKDFFGEDADEFKPERWLGKDGLRPGWEYLPFNGGPRICPGREFTKQGLIF